MEEWGITTEDWKSSLVSYAHNQKVVSIADQGRGKGTPRVGKGKEES